MSIPIPVPPITGIQAWYSYDNALVAAMSADKDVLATIGDASGSLGLGTVTGSVYQTFNKGVHFYSGIITTPSVSINRRDFSVVMIPRINSIQQDVTSNPSVMLKFGASSTNFQLRCEGSSSAKFGSVTYFDGSGTVDTGFVPDCGLSLLAISGGASNVEIYQNGNSATSSVLSAGTDTGSVVFGSFSSGLYPTQLSMMAFGIVDHALTSGDKAALKTWAETYFPLSYTKLNTLVVAGDSRTQGNQVFDNEAWPFLLGVAPTCRLWGYGTNSKRIGANTSDAQTLQSEGATTVDTKLVVGEKNVLIVFAGENDLRVDGITGAQCSARLDAYLTARRSAGWTGNNKIVVTQIPNYGGAEWTTYNTHIAALNSTLCDCVVILPASLLDVSNGNFANDGLHLSSGGQKLFAKTVLAAIGASGI